MEAYSKRPILRVGQRPKCLHCHKELRPNYKRPYPPYNISPASKPAWRKENPAVFKGTYGSYGDNRFCGLRCAYNWARNISKDPLI